MGFDGKTLIHPSQVAVANDVFGYSSEEVADARDVLTVVHRLLDFEADQYRSDGWFIAQLQLFAVAVAK